MDETTFRVLDALSADLGSPVSIKKLTDKVRKLHKTAYYKNIYDKIQELERKGIIKLERIGKSSITTLNFDNFSLPDLLTQTEIRKKQNLLENRTELQLLLLEMGTLFKQEFCLINSISIVDPVRTIPLNRAEFLFILKEAKKLSSKGMEQFIRNEILNIHLTMRRLQKTHNIKLDCLILSENEFFELLRERRYNPVKCMLSSQIAFFSPQNYWTGLKEAIIGGIKIELAEEINPVKISEQDLVYNLSRFGYKEIGPGIKQGKELCLECTIVSILIRGDARRIEAVTILLAKNRPRYNVLLFLCGKYGKLEKLLGLLKASNRIVKNEERENAIKILEKLETKEEKADEKAIRQKMRLYHAV